jgi:hypothetical protein
VGVDGTGVGGTGVGVGGLGVGVDGTGVGGTGVGAGGFGVGVGGTGVGAGGFGVGVGDFGVGVEVVLFPWTFTWTNDEPITVPFASSATADTVWMPLVTWVEFHRYWSDVPPVSRLPST